MESNCAKCGGLIMEYGKAYLYAGKVCSCIQPRHVNVPITHTVFMQETREKKLEAVLIKARDDFAKIADEDNDECAHCIAHKALTAINEVLS